MRYQYHGQNGQRIIRACLEWHLAKKNPKIHSSFLQYYNWNAGNPDIFKSAYNDVVNNYWRISLLEERLKDSTGNVIYDAGGNATIVWRKDWARSIPKDYAGLFNVESVGEWLWTHFIGDGLKNYTELERAYVNAFLATGYDFPLIVDSINPDKLITIDALKIEPQKSHIIAHKNSILPLDSTDATARRTANLHIGLAINFIVATPFMFAIGG